MSINEARQRLETAQAHIDEAEGMLDGSDQIDWSSIELEVNLAISELQKVREASLLASPAGGR